MKRITKITGIVSLTGLFLLFNGCIMVHTAGNSGKVPPGQAKKATGEKSAKKYAPGQQNK